ncbi:MAG: restriction endonuclease subunit S [Bacteroidales bacterium]|nr:restriction endonuclease subunit S [Candidatus Colimorpha merdihippi]
MKYKLADLLTIYNGCDHKHLGTGCIPVYGSGGIMRYVDSALSHGPSILLPRKGTIDNIQYVEGPFWSVDTAYYTKINTEIANPYYLYCYLCSLDLSGLVSGTGLPSMTFDSYYHVVVDLPQIDYQNKVANCLMNLDRKIALNRKINAELEQMAKELYDYWFVQFDFPNAEGKPYKSSHGKMVYNDQLKRKIPEGWSNARLIDIANITMGQSPEGSTYNGNGDGVLFYQGSTDFGERFPQVRQYTTSPTRFAKKGDILMSVRAPVGATNIANNDCCIGRGLCAMNSKIGSITHLYYIIKTFEQRFNHANASGTTFGSITKEELHQLPVIKPEQSIINQFESICQPIFDKQMTIGEENNRLVSLRDQLLPLLMNGQVKIK